jgi:hypothetical protein
MRFCCNSIDGFENNGTDNPPRKKEKRKLFFLGMSKHVEINADKKNVCTIKMCAQLNWIRIFLVFSDVREHGLQLFYLFQGN